MPRFSRLPPETVEEIRDYAKSHSIKATADHFKRPLYGISKIVNGHTYKDQRVWSENRSKLNHLEHLTETEVLSLTTTAMQPYLDKFDNVVTRLIKLEQDIVEFNNVKEAIMDECDQFIYNLGIEFDEKINEFTQKFNKLTF